jgi:nitroimidazol reductase NimA-like FMN-containing flavoprotein (pyridoxamine 5'-phosphate oxidase superfamily)
MPGYGIPPARSAKDYLPWSWAQQRLERARNYWIATARPDGRPHLMPVWGVWVSGALYFGTDRGSRKARNVAHNPAMAAHVDIEDDAVILEGLAREVTDKATLAAVDRAYLKKYKMKLTDAPGDSFYCELRPTVIFAWSEKQFAKKATRYSLVK